MKGKNRIRKSVLMLLLIGVLLISLSNQKAYGSPENEDAPYSDYEIIFDKEGVLSVCHEIDEGIYQVGDVEVSRTYVFRFATEEFTIENATGEVIGAANMRKADGTQPASGTLRASARNAAFFENTIGCKTTGEAAAALGYSYAADIQDAYFLYFDQTGSGTELHFALLILIDENGTLSPRAELGQVIALVTGENEQNWYRENDRWNGKEYSKKGFWADMSSVLANAQSVYNSTSSAKETFNNAASELRTAVPKLIPSTQTNATPLYEKLNDIRNASRRLN